MMDTLKGKSYVVTGGARGIGLACCQAIIAAGGQVAVLDILSEPDSSAVALQQASKYHYFCCDIAQQQSLEPAFHNAVIASGGRIDGCVLAAGIGLDKPFVDISWAEFDRLMRVNQAGIFFVAQLATRTMLLQDVDHNGIRGNIVSIASRSASGACPGHLLSAYGGSKGFVKSFTLQLGHELAGKGIRVNCISPGYIETELNLSLARIRPEVQYFFNEAPPLKRIGQTSDVAGGLIYLLSDVASYVTAIDLPIDGGMTAGTGLTK